MPTMRSVGASAPTTDASRSIRPNSPSSDAFTPPLYERPFAILAPVTRTLIVSDVHANLAALEAAIRDAESGGPIDAVWSLGDCVGDRTPFAGCQLFRLADGEQIELDPNIRMVVNPGSVGQPRDGDPRASYAIYVTDSNSITLRRVEYAIDATQKLMAGAGLPRWLIERLSAGR